MGYHYLVFTFLLVVCCKPESKKVVVKDESPCTSSSLAEPDRYDLPIALKEISGLSYSILLDQWITINDEKGKLYFLDNNFELVSSVSFGPSGDYEGIEVVDDLVYIINSKGDIHRYNYKLSKKLKPIKTKLSIKNDVEGLGYLPDQHALLIACKGNPYTKKKKKSNKVKAVYLFDLDKEEFIDEPHLFINDEELVAFVKNKYGHLDKKCKNRLQHFAPSGVTFYNGYYYVLSSTSKCIAVIDKNEIVQDLIFLDKNHYQPEGIFIRNNHLYISNEAKGVVSKLYKYPFD